MLAVCSRSSSMGTHRCWEHRAGPPWSRAAQRQRGGQPAPGRPAEHAHAGRIDAEVGGLIGQPAQRGVAVVERRRGRGARGRGGSRRTPRPRPAGGRGRGVGVRGVDAADHEPAAVDVDDRGHCTPHATSARRRVRRRRARRPAPGSTGRRRRASRCRRRRPVPRGTAGTALRAATASVGGGFTVSAANSANSGSNGVGHRGIVGSGRGAGLQALTSSTVRGARR